MTGYTQDLTSSSSLPAELEEPLVILEFSSFEDFLQSCTSRICETGLFLETEPRERVSSPLRFELRIRDGFRLLKGEGEVIRVHDPMPSSDAPAGLAVRFTQLDEASQKLLPVVLKHYHQRGVPLLDMEAQEAGVEVEVTEQELATEEVAEVTLDDLWEEFEVVADRRAGAGVDESVAEAAAEPLLVDAGQFGTTVESEESAIVSETVDEVEDVSQAPIEGDGTSESESTEELMASEVAVEAESEDETEDEKEESPEKGETLEDEALDLAGVLPTAPGAISSSGDVELLPDESTQGEEFASSPEERSKELWLMLPMAVLGILIGLIVYLSYHDGFDWPWSLGADSGEPASTELLAAFQEQVPDDRDVIAVLNFEDPSQVEILSGESEEGAAVVPPAPRPTRREVSPPNPSPQKANPQRTRPQQASASKKDSPARTSRKAELTGVDRITWQESQDQTVLTLWGDGPFDTDQLVVFRLDTGTPRQVVKILGISRPFTERNLAVGTSHVSAIRTGLHAGDVGQELHVVADLEDPAVRMRRLEPEGSQLRVYFSKL
jgi:hypothetical protein